MDLVVVMRLAAQEWEGDKDTLLAGALETDYIVVDSTQEHGMIISVWANAGYSETFSAERNNSLQTLVGLGMFAHGIYLYTYEPIVSACAPYGSIYQTVNSTSC